MDATEQGLDLLRQAGIRYAVHSATRLRLEDRDIRVFSPTTPPSPSVVERDLATVQASAHPNDALLYIVTHAPDSLRKRALVDDRVSYISTRDAVVLFARNEHVMTAGGTDGSKPAAVRRRPWGRSAVARALLRIGRPQTQMELAKAAGISQAAVSHALAALKEQVIRTDRGWVATSPAELFAQSVREYPGPGGITTYWYGLENLSAQAEVVLDHAGRGAALLAGDNAADMIAPWRRLRRSTVFARTGIDLRQSKFSQATAENATLALTIPEDPTIWSTATAWYGDYASVTDPILTAWVVRETAGSDAGEAEKQLQQTVVANWDATT